MIFLKIIYIVTLPKDFGLFITTIFYCKNLLEIILLTTNICLLLPCPCSLDTFNPLVDTVLH
jgi:hypothetical protein